MNNNKFQEFVNIVNLTLDRYSGRLHRLLTSSEDEYLAFVQERFDELLFLVGNDKSDESVKWLERQLALNYGLHIPIEWGTYAEGYFDNFSKRVEVHWFFEHATCYDDIRTYDRRKFELVRKCEEQKVVKPSNIIDEDDDLPF